MIQSKLNDCRFFILLKTVSTIKLVHTHKCLLGHLIFPESQGLVPWSLNDFSADLFVNCITADVASEKETCKQTM